MDRSRNTMEEPLPPRPAGPRHALFVAPLVAASLVLAACGGGGGGGGPTPPPVPTPAPTPPPGPSPAAGAYIATLPAWSTFAPDKVDRAEEAKEIEDTTVPPTVEDLLQGNKTLSCTTRKVSFYKTPDEYAMFSPPLDVLYPGQLVQRRTLRDGASPSDIRSLTITDRNPVTISIPACLTNDNSRTVPPTLDAVNQARASIVASALAQNASCVSAIGSLRTETYRNDVHKALKIGLSGKYFGFSAKADTSLSKSKTENGLSVTFTEQLYRVQYQAPQTPAEVFSSSFTQARLDEQIALQRIGPDNLPVYVAEVVYGRLMNFSMVSNASETEMEAAVKAAYSVAGGLGGSIKGKIDSKYEQVLEASRYSVAYLGGSAAANSAMLKNLNWGDYFSIPVTAADAVPISFTLRNLSDNSIAVVQELTSYDLTTCVEKLADDATFGFRPEQTLTPGFSVAGSALVAMADIDGRNGKDIVMATTALGARGEIRVALSNGDGSFAPFISAQHPGVVQSGEFDLAVGDVDADGRADVILNTRERTVGNRVYVTFYKDGAGSGGAAGFVYSAVQDMGGPNADWQNFKLRVAQMDGVRGVDLVWNNTPISTTANQTFIGHAVDTRAAGFDLASAPLFVRTSSLTHFANNFSGYEYTHIADFNGDGRSDIVWHNIDDAGNRYYIALGTLTGLDFGGTSANSRNFRNFGGSWSVYTALAGDVTGGGKADLVQPRTRRPFNASGEEDVSFGIYVSQGSPLATRAFTDSHAFQSRDRVKDLSIAGLLDRATENLDPQDQNRVREGSLSDMLLGDVDADGRQDLIINDKGKSEQLKNKIGVGLGATNGTFSFARVAQEVPAARDWSNHQALIADVNADGRDDVVWISPGVTTSVFVGTARGN